MFSIFPSKIGVICFIMDNLKKENMRESSLNRPTIELIKISTKTACRQLYLNITNTSISSLNLQQ